ncbi:MAG: glucose 1-dehydrogenase [Lachnospiraceae bacterium]|nr:glucose 1-dehydrogenase [Lachnospiraceae bacterium]
MKFSDKVVVVTGSSSGIGADAAKKFGKEGAKVVVHCSKNIAGAEEVAGEIRAAGSDAFVCQANFANPDEIEKFYKKIIDEFGTIDILVSNAAAHDSFIPTADMPLETWQETIAVDLTATFLNCKYALPHMLKKNKGTIITVSSGAGVVVGAGGVGYTCSKTAVIALTKQIAWEYGTQGIRANCVCPGIIDTPMLRKHTDIEAVEGMLKKSICGRLGKPEDIANTILFLASEEASYINGEKILVDGGYVVKRG